MRSLWYPNWLPELPAMPFGWSNAINWRKAPEKQEENFSTSGQSPAPRVGLSTNILTS